MRIHAKLFFGHVTEEVAELDTPVEHVELGNLPGTSPTKDVQQGILSYMVHNVLSKYITEKHEFTIVGYIEDMATVTAYTSNDLSKVEATLKARAAEEFGW